MEEFELRVLRDRDETVEAIIFFRNLTRLSWSMLVMVQHSHPHICLCAKDMGRSWGGKTFLKCDSDIMSLLVSLQYAPGNPTGGSEIRSKCKSLTEISNNNLPTRSLVSSPRELGTLTI